MKVPRERSDSEEILKQIKQNKQRSLMQVSNILMSSASSKIGASILNQSARQIDSEKSKQSLPSDKKQIMQSPQMQKGTTPFYISGFQPVANNSIIKVPIPNKSLYSEHKEF
jgi:isocitrate lyase